MENKLPFYINLFNPLSEEVTQILNEAYEEAKSLRHEYLAPEHVLKVIAAKDIFKKSMAWMKGSSESIQKNLEQHFSSFEKIPEGINYDPVCSIQLHQLLKNADDNVISCGKNLIELIHLIRSLLHLEESWAQYFLYNEIKGKEGLFLALFLGDAVEENMEEEDIFDDEFDPFGFPSEKEKKGNWKKHLICLHDTYKERNPLIGREDELIKTIRVLSRKDKNNPLHLGDPGVGKTALVYGLVKKIEEGEVPDNLQSAKVYSLNLGNIVAGTQYRGDFERKMKNIMEGASEEGNVIIYIDEIHNLVGTGTVGESSLDASNFLKPYLETGKIRFIGATTYDEYKRYFAKSKSLVRRFTPIDIKEPSEEETIEIIQHLKERYEDFHKVKYTEDAIEFAVRGSAKYITDRFLPDKAIDLIDESGAEKQLERNGENPAMVDKETISKVLAKLCKVDSIAITEEDPKDLERLEERISTRLFGQDRAVSEVSEAILMSKAGLNDDEKPLASLLFVGPTGVGKTELAKLLSKELGIELIRFDMSEYTEKHAVAKLIGSPAGYVGYEDGGLLTDAIRKTPNAVLLLDEIEKAHPDIYNILLQVMDYAKLTDNKGNKADFRNVVLIMTSNAGAQYAAQSNVGFASNIKQGDAMLKQVKKVFKPEFLNRLSATVVFNDMTREMASLILDKKLRELETKLNVKNVKMNLSEEAKDFLLKKGFTKEYGARELDRVIHHELKRLLMKELLYGSLKEGGDVEIDVVNDKLSICRKQS